MRADHDAADDMAAFAQRWPLIDRKMREREMLLAREAAEKAANEVPAPTLPASPLEEIAEFHCAGFWRSGITLVGALAIALVWAAGEIAAATFHRMRDSILGDAFAWIVGGAVVFALLVIAITALVRFAPGGLQ